MASATFDGTYQDFSFPILRGNDYVLRFGAVTPNAGAVPPYGSGNSVVTDLTEWGAFWCTGKFRRDLGGPTDAGALFQVTLAGGQIAITDPSGGVGTVTLDAALTLQLPPGVTVYVDVKGRDGSGLERTLCTGLFLVRSGVTMSS